MKFRETLDETAALLARWREHPEDFVRENFLVEPDKWQLRALRGLVGPGVHKISLKACAGPGKSCIEAWALLWFISLHGKPGSYPKAACLSNTRENLRDGLWAEVNKWHGRSEFLKSQFEINAERLYQKDHKAEWFISARSFAQTASPEAMGESLSGIHADYVCVVLDESGGIHPIMLKRAKQAMSSVVYGLIIQGGNPTSREGCLFAAENEDGWLRISVTGDPDDPERSPRVDLEGAKESIQLYGRDNAWVRVFVLGQFPESSLNTLLGEGQVREAMTRVLRDTEYNWSQKRIGTDVARFGDDRTVLFPRQGRQAFAAVVMRKQDSKAIAGRLAVGIARFGSELNMIDDTGGWAGGVIDFSGLAGNYLLPVNMSGSADDEDAFANKRAECYWRAAQWVKGGGALPEDDDLPREACAATYFINAQGRIQIEEKVQIKKRLGKSPDKWDAFCLTFAVPERAGSAVDPLLAGLQKQGSKVISDVVDDMNPLAMQAAEGRPGVDPWNQGGLDRM